LTIGNGPYFRNEGGALAIASSGGTFPYLATRLRLMDELETHKPPFPQFGAGRPFHVRFPEGVRAWLDRFSTTSRCRAAVPRWRRCRRSLGRSVFSTAATGPFVERDFVVDQLNELMTIPPFAGDAFSAMENGNARHLFKRFA
jgi:hypothetical protein